MAEAQVSLDVSDLKENFLECSVCLEHFDQAERRPRLLVNCLHTFCSQCLEKLLEKEGRGQITCPNCRQVQKVKGTAQSLPVDPVRNKLVDYVQFKKGKNIPCTDCPDGSHAVARCHECRSYMCTPCKEAHLRNRLSRKHTCQSLEEAMSEPVKSFFIHRCQDHPDYKIEFYCRECSSPCCVSCAIVKHKGHRLDPIEDAANSMLSLLKKKTEEVEKSASVLRSMKSSLDEKNKIQEVNLKHTTDSINNKFDELFGKLNCQRNILITELKDRTKSTVNGLQKQREATEDSLAQMESTLEYFKQMESKSDDCEVLSAGPVLVKSLEAAAAVDLTEVVQDPTWTFSPREMDSVISKVHRFGEIHSDTKRKEVTDIDSRKKDVHEEEFDSEDYSKVVPNLTLHVNQAIVDSPLWVDAQTNLSKLGTVSTDGRGHTIIEGSYDNIMKARDHLMRLHSNTLETKEDRFSISKSQMDTKLEPPIDVSPAHYEALQYFLGEKSIREHCTIVNEKNMKRLHFVCNEQNRQLVESLKMQAEEIMQDEYDFQKEAIQVSQEKAASVPKDVMEYMSNVFMKYIPNDHSILIFSEDWNVMPKAKRMVKINLGQVKTDRSKRRFLGPKSSTSKPETKDRSFVVESGCGKAEGEHITVKVYKRNITELTLDAIVNAANGQLHHGGGVARAIAAAAGDQLRAEGKRYVLKNGDIPVTELAVTTAGKLPCRMVFHAVGPKWDKYTDKKKCLEDLCRTILRCLCEAENRKLTTIAIPPISSTIFGVPQEECAKMYVRALRSFDLTVNQGSLLEVHFVDGNQKMIQIITDEMSRNWMSQTDKEDVKRDSDFIEHCLHPGAADVNYPSDQLDLTSKNKFKVGKKTTNCSIIGNMPEGEMTIRVNSLCHLPGYEKFPTIEIVYTFLDGIQKENHPHPGQHYKGTRRTAYLPDSPDGREVLALLKVAWERKLTFTLGRSVTIGDNLDRVVWNEIHHKTNKYGGATNFGYPDPGYLKRVKEELAAKGVTVGV